MIKMFLVGGVARDLFLGKTPGDVDVVFTGVDFNDAVNAWGNPVGGFPVWPHKNLDVALARTERKTGKGYMSFAVNTKNVSIFDDLSRRDFTVNALAIHVKDFDVIPSLDDIHKVVTDFLKHYTPKKDDLIIPDTWKRDDVLFHLDNKLLIPVSQSAFIQDPLRAVRLAKFASRDGFTPSKHAIQLAKTIPVDDYKALPKDRLIKELKKSGDIAKFFDVIVDMNLGWLFDLRIIRFIRLLMHRDMSVVKPFLSNRDFVISYLLTADWLANVDRKLAKFSRMIDRLDSTDPDDIFNFMHDNFNQLPKDKAHIFVTGAIGLTTGKDVAYIVVSAFTSMYKVQGTDYMDIWKNVDGPTFGKLLKAARYQVFNQFLDNK